MDDRMRLYHYGEFLSELAMAREAMNADRAQKLLRRLDRWWYAHSADQHHFETTDEAYAHFAEAIEQLTREPERREDDDD